MQAAQLPDDVLEDGTSANRKEQFHNKSTKYFYSEKFIFKQTSDIFTQMHKHMKHIGIIIICMVVASCKNNTVHQQQPIKCSTANDVVLLGYHGKIKHIEQRQYSLKDCTGFEIDPSDFIQTDIDFDTNGLVTNYTITTDAGGNKHLYIHDSIHTIGINYYNLPLPQNIESTDSTIRNWISDTVYTHQNFFIYKTPFADTVVETQYNTYTLDNQCKIRQIEYRKRKDAAIERTSIYAPSKNSDTLTYFYNNTMGDHQVILKRDHQNNPLEVRLHFSNSCDALIYTYTYYK